MKKIIVVDDDNINLLMFDSLLSDKYTVEFAVSGQQCLACVNQFIPDLIIMDYQMPGLTGIETVQKLRLTASLENVPIIICSANSVNELQGAMKSLGLVFFLPKPIDVEQLYDYVDRCLSDSPN